MSFLTAVDAQFGRNHLIYIAICLVFIVASCIYIKKSKIEFNKIINIFLVIWVIAEFVKLVGVMHYLLSNGEIVPILNYQPEPGVKILTAFLPRSEIPIHLCKLQPLFLIVYKLSNNQKIKNFILGFIFPTGILGGLVAILIGTVGANFLEPRTHEFYLYHAALIVLSCSIVIKKVTHIGFQSFKQCVISLSVLMVISIYVNSMFSDTGLTDYDAGIYANFLYTMEPPAGNLPLLNFNHGWFVYIFNMIIIGIVLMAIIHTPFFIKDLKARKTKLQKEN